MTLRAILLFPPNWTACVSGPHLALPLMAGVAKRLGWQAETWDLSEIFYRTYAVPPTHSSLLDTVHDQNFDVLDELYFGWEDQFRSIDPFNESNFGLLTGYRFHEMKSMSLAEVAKVTIQGTVYSKFLERVINKLETIHPQVIGLTIASREQVVPAIQLLSEIRTKMPETFLVLGGNNVTRLRASPAFNVFTSLVDHIVLFQGDVAFANVLTAIRELGVKNARRDFPKVTSDELVPYESWPVPDFSGIAFDKMIGTPVLSYVSTRGCYWGKCAFCAIPAGWSTKGYGGSAPPDFVAHQLVDMTRETGIPRVKFVDEAVPPSKVVPLSRRLTELGANVEWEGYVRLEPAWEDLDLLKEAHDGGLRKLYFGLEQAPSTNRLILGKNDRGDAMKILRGCKQVGIKVHLFCMVGHPGSSHADARATVRFLVENESLIDTADLAGFRLDRGTKVPGVRPLPEACDWSMALQYEPTQDGVLSNEEVSELEVSCQEELWETVPRLLHPLYRIVGHWDATHISNRIPSLQHGEAWFDSSSLMRL